MWGEGREKRAERENEVILAQRRYQISNYVVGGSNLMRQSGSKKVKLRKRVFLSQVNSRMESQDGKPRMMKSKSTQVDRDIASCIVGGKTGLPNEMGLGPYLGILR